MGKYDTNKEWSRNELIQFIANELAEANRLKRLELRDAGVQTKELEDQEQLESKHDLMKRLADKVTQLTDENKQLKQKLEKIEVLAKTYHKIDEPYNFGELLKEILEQESKE